MCISLKIDNIPGTAVDDPISWSSDAEMVAADAGMAGDEATANPRGSESDDGEPADSEGNQEEAEEEASTVPEAEGESEEEAALVPGPKAKAAPKAKSKAAPKAKAKAAPKAKAKAAPKAKAKAAGVADDVQQELVVAKAKSKAKAKAAPEELGVTKAKSKAHANAVPEELVVAKAKSTARAAGEANAMRCPPLDGRGVPGAAKAAGNPRGKAKAKAASTPEAEGEQLAAENEDQQTRAIAIGPPPLQPTGVTPCSLVFDERVLCGDCGRYSHFTKCRVISKQSGLWRCASCGVKAVQLRRIFGEWPTRDFTTLTQDVREPARRSDFLTNSGTAAQRLT